MAARGRKAVDKKDRHFSLSFSFDTATADKLKILVAVEKTNPSMVVRRLIRMGFYDYQKRAERYEKDRDHEKTINQLEKQLLLG